MVVWAVFHTFVVDADGNRNFPYLNENGKRWNLNWNWIENDLDRNGRLASSGNWQRMMVGNARRVSFGLCFVGAIRRAFFLSHSIFLKSKHIFCCPAL